MDQRKGVFPLVKQKGFFYSYGEVPGLGILAVNKQEGWQRVNLYGFGVDVDVIQKAIEDGCEADLVERGKLAARPAQSRVVIAGGVVFKGLTCLAGDGVGAEELLAELEKGLPPFHALRAGEMEKAEDISPMRVYVFTYAGKVIGVSKVVFFEYATQVSLVGIYRDQDRNLVDELYTGLSSLRHFLTIPNPLRTDDRDQRVEVNMFMIRHPVKEELQGDFVRSLIGVPGLAFYSFA